MTTSKSFLHRAWLQLQIFLLSVMLTIILFLTFVFVFIPIYIFRFLLSKSAPWIRPDLAKILSTRSAVVAIDDLTGVPTYTLIAACTVEGTVEIDFIREEVMKKIILSTVSSTSVHDHSDSENQLDCEGVKESLNYPEFQQYFDTWLNFTFWRWDHDFAIENHVTIWEPSEVKIVDEIDVAKLRLELVRKPFQPKRAYWEMILVKNFVPSTELNKENKKSVVIFRVHHSVLDGYALLQVFMTQMMGEKVCQSQLPVPKVNFIERHWLSSFCLYLTAVLLIPYTVCEPEGIIELYFLEFTFSEMVRNQFECNDRNAFRVPEEQLTRKIFPASDKVPMSLILEARRINGHASFTPIILSMLTGGIRNFMIANNMEIPNSMHVVMPLPWPGHPSKLRNYWTFCAVTLPISLADPVKRLEKCQKNWMDMRRSAMPGLNFALVPLIGGLTNGLMKLVFVGNRLPTVLLSNFPGPPVKAHFFGHRLLDASFGGGLGRGNLGFGMAMLSHGDSLRINIGIDQAILPQIKVQQLMNFISGELKVLAKQSDIV